MNLNFRRSAYGRVAFTLLSLVLLGTAVHPAEAQTKPALLKGGSWATIAKLPDWSGAWTLMGGGRVQAEEAGRYPDNGRVQLTPKYEEMRKASAAAHVQSNLSRCLPAGTPGILKHLVMHEYLFTLGRVTMMFEDGESRRIYTDGRKHRPLGEMRASYMGDSIGHWEGSVLVVDTTGFPNGSLWKDFGMLATINTHLQERIFLNKDGKLQIDSVVSDPEIFSTPYASSSLFQRSSATMPEPACAQNNRDTGESVDLTPPPEE